MARRATREMGPGNRSAVTRRAAVVTPTAGLVTPTAAVVERTVFVVTPRVGLSLRGETIGRAHVPQAPENPQLGSSVLWADCPAT